jgi:hypothetical protein
MGLLWKHGAATGASVFLSCVCFAALAFASGSALGSTACGSPQRYETPRIPLPLFPDMVSLVVRGCRFYLCALFNSAISRAIQAVLLMCVCGAIWGRRYAPPNNSILYDARTFLLGGLLSYACCLCVGAFTEDNDGIIAVLLVSTQVCLVLSTVCHVASAGRDFLSVTCQVASAAHLCIFPAASVLSLQYSCVPTEALADAGKDGLGQLVLLASAFCGLSAYVLHALVTSGDLVAGPVVAAFFTWTYWLLTSLGPQFDSAAFAAAVCGCFSICCNVFALWQQNSKITPTGLGGCTSSEEKSVVVLVV